MEEVIKEISFTCLSEKVKHILVFSKSQGNSSHSHNLLSDAASMKF